MTPVVVRVRDEHDVTDAREAARAVARSLGFGAGAIAQIVTSVSELAQNLVEHARGGEVRLSIEGDDTFVAVVHDDGPGIADLARAMEDGFSTGSGLGLGLPGARRMMDELTIDSAPGRGTTITIKRRLDAPLPRG